MLQLMPPISSGWIRAAALGTAAAFALSPTPTAAIGRGDVADVVCEYAEADPPGPIGNELRITTNDYVGEVEIDRRLDEVLVKEEAGNSAPCTGSERPTITNLDEISLRVVRESVDSMIVDLRNGPFAPGATPEPDGTPEIEISLEAAPGTVLSLSGSSADDHVELGALDRIRYGVNLNPDAETVPDADVIARNALVILALRGGDDRVGSLGKDGFASGPFDFALAASGGAGNDALIGNDRRNWLLGGPGDDRLVGNGLGDYLFGRAGRDRIEARDRHVDRISCGGGRDALRADRIDRARDCE